MIAPYSSTPPSMAPRRFAPNATVDAPTSRNRCEKTRFARNTGANASAIAARNRGIGSSDSNASGGTNHATTRLAASSAVEEAPVGQPEAARHLDRPEHGEQDPGEHQRVHQPRGAEQERELHDVLRLEQQERRTHEEQVEVRAHLPERTTRPDAHGHDRCQQHERERHEVAGGDRPAPQVRERVVVGRRFRRVAPAPRTAQSQTIESASQPDRQHRLGAGDRRPARRDRCTARGRTPARGSRRSARTRRGGSSCTSRTRRRAAGGRAPSASPPS